MPMNSEALALAAILLLSLLGHNTSVAYAAGIVLVLKLLGVTSAISALGTYGLMGHHPADNGHSYPDCQRGNHR